jgi:hypothetical protein
MPGGTYIEPKCVANVHTRGISEQRGGFVTGTTVVVD